MGRFVSGNDIIDSGNIDTTVSFADILNKPNTLAGYGIIDGAQVNNIDFNSIVNRPTTLAGYGITDSVGSDTVDFVAITNKPTTLAGYGITDALTVGGDGTVTTLPFSGITGLPTTTEGYGITNAVTTEQLNTVVTAAVEDAIITGGGGGSSGPTHSYNLDTVSNNSVTLPLSPVEGESVLVVVSNGLYTNTINRNGQTIMGRAEDLVIDTIKLPVTLQFILNDWKLV